MLCDRSTGRLAGWLVVCVRYSDCSTLAYTNVANGNSQFSFPRCVFSIRIIFESSVSIVVVVIVIGRLFVN